ncbi:TPA: PRD domain-containing protein [Streptococcus equi subsp. zooepidemicus]|uniref:PRD domain-containing protein n=1 Tax=Streptococcus equi TaxID=1336 RepID=UPI0005BB0590|nr:PRD domain-containing protein [Streptococcus equi]HEL0640801.1 PRD domain-containing protein [Streptococcus equi subsp. zooepidemicus]KIS09224.1 transcription antiterminator LacT [Streptococcus equi subsp. zooepidemicus Sz5]KIS15435.1 transcription antiterminator LacT [Streptococcus equi subsp. zooepidemicus SzAM60]HEL1178645.1 PRD domain-containing protein [Streptococcus equi subsp. zooepidemicus]HEL1235815.1 PRD domain-containing protein [Streptococcus equi subsp. zooepidemicus]
MFRLIRPLNNNAALVKNAANEQAVVMGVGIAFQKKKGDLIREEAVEKTFLLKNDEARENLLLLLKDVPLDFITVTYDVIDWLVLTYHYPVQQYLYVTLTDHIYAAYHMLQKGTYSTNRLPDISKEFGQEYEMAQAALEMFRQRLRTAFPDDEVTKIALHFINAKGEESSPQREHSSTKKLLNQVEAALMANGITRTSTNSHFYDRLMIHLTYFIQSLDRKNQGYHAIGSLEEQIKKEYPRAYEIGSAIYQLMTDLTGQELVESEKIYIVIHIQRLL